MRELGKNAFSFEVLILPYIGHNKFYLSDYKLFAAPNQLLTFDTNKCREVSYSQVWFMLIQGIQVIYCLAEGVAFW